MAKARARPVDRRSGIAESDNSSERMQWAPARHAAAAREVGVREWGQLLIERGQQLLSRAEREVDEAGLGPKRTDGRSDRLGEENQRRRGG